MAPRGNPILGLSRFRENSTQLPYTSLIYGNGPGNHQPRRDPTIGPNSTDSPYYVQFAAIHQEEAFHDGSDVAIFAAGPYAHLFQGTQEQSYIAHVFAYAMCIGDYTNQPHCLASSAGDDLSDQIYDTSRQVSSISAANPSFGRPAQSDQSKSAAAPSLGAGSTLVIPLASALVLQLLLRLPVRYPARKHVGRVQL